MGVELQIILIKLPLRARLFSIDLQHEYYQSHML